MKKLYLTLISILIAQSAFASPTVLDACEVKLMRDLPTIQNGLIYSYDQATLGKLVVLGPQDPNKICDATDRVVLKVLPIYFGGTNAVGLTLALYVANGDQSISVHAWDGNAISDIMGYYAGLRLGAGLFIGAQGFMMNKTDFWNSEISLDSTAWVGIGAKLDLSIAEIHIRVVEPSNSDWNLALHAHD